MKSTKTLEAKILYRMGRKKVSVFLREDFLDLSGYDQVGRVLKELTRKGKLVKIGYGLYAKTKVSGVTGQPVPVEPLPSLARQALKRLGVTPLATKAEKDYVEGRSTQVPTGRQIGVDKRINRKIGYKDATIYYERSTR